MGLRTASLTRALAAVAGGWLVGTTARAQDLPYTFEEVVEIVRAGVVPEPRLRALLHERCVAFRATPAALERLRGEGASAAVLEAVGSACRVMPGEPRRLRIEPDSLFLRAGERSTLTVRGVGGDGAPLARVRVRWVSADTNVARVDAAGRVTAAAPGMTSLRAVAANGVAAEAWVWVLTPAEAVGPRAGDPRTALWVGLLVPGAAQFYTGQPEKGVAVFGGVAAALGLAFAVEDGGRHPLLVPGLLAAAGLWAYGVLDGQRAARATRPDKGAAPAVTWRLRAGPAPDPQAGAWLGPHIALRY